MFKKRNKKKIIADRTLTYLDIISNTLQSIDQRLSNLEKCVQVSDRRYGDKYSISSKHWNT
jgi:hypothetical protein